MTKQVLIVNADSNAYSISITSQDRVKDTWVETAKAKLTHPGNSIILNVFPGRRLIIEEVGSNGYEYREKI